MVDFHVEKYESHGVAFLDDAKNVILGLADRIRELEKADKEVDLKSVGIKDKTTSQKMTDLQCLVGQLTALLTERDVIENLREWDIDWSDIIGIGKFIDNFHGGNLGLVEKLNQFEEMYKQSEKQRADEAREVVKMIALGLTLDECREKTLNCKPLDKLKTDLVQLEKKRENKIISGF